MAEVCYAEQYKGPKYVFTPKNDDEGTVYTGDVKPVKHFNLRSAADALFSKSDKNTWSRMFPDIANRIAPYFDSIAPFCGKFEKGGKLFGSFCDVRKFPSEMVKTFEMVRGLTQGKLPGVIAVISRVSDTLNSIGKAFKFRQKLMGKGKGFDYVGLVIDATDLFGASMQLYGGWKKWGVLSDLAEGFVPYQASPTESVTAFSPTGAGPEASPPPPPPLADSSGRLTVDRRASPEEVGARGEQPKSGSPDTRLQKGAKRHRQQRLAKEVEETVKLEVIDAALSVAFFVAGAFLSSVGLFDRFKATKRWVPQVAHDWFGTGYCVLYTAAACRAVVGDTLSRYKSAIKEAGYSFSAEGVWPTWVDSTRDSVFGGTTPAAGRGSVT